MISKLLPGFSLLFWVSLTTFQSFKYDWKSWKHNLPGCRVPQTWNPEDLRNAGEKAFLPHWQRTLILSFHCHSIPAVTPPESIPPDSILSPSHTCSRSSYALPPYSQFYVRPLSRVVLPRPRYIPTSSLVAPGPWYPSKGRHR